MLWFRKREFEKKLFKYLNSNQKSFNFEKNCFNFEKNCFNFETISWTDVFDQSNLWNFHHHLYSVKNWIKTLIFEWKWFQNEFRSSYPVFLSLKLSEVLLLTRVANKKLLRHPKTRKNERSRVGTSNVNNYSASANFKME